MAAVDSSSSPSPSSSIKDILRAHINLLNGNNDDRRIAGSVLRYLSSIRHHITGEILNNYNEDLLYPSGQIISKKTKTEEKNKKMEVEMEMEVEASKESKNDHDTETKNKEEKDRNGIKKEEECSPTTIRSKLYISLLSILYLMDNNDLVNALKLAQYYCSEIKLDSPSDAIHAKIFFYREIIQEKLFYSDSIDNATSMNTDMSSTISMPSLPTPSLSTYTSSEKNLLNLFQYASIKHLQTTHVMLYILILRMYYREKRFDLALKFLDKSKFPIDNASGPQSARYHYYYAYCLMTLGNYSEAENHLQEALRKTPATSTNFDSSLSGGSSSGNNSSNDNPSNSILASDNTSHIASSSPSSPSSSGLSKSIGFQRHIYKLLVIVQLLRGEISSRPLFHRPQFLRSLYPYYQLTKSVYLGNFGEFTRVVEKYQSVFIHDRTLLLITRLHENVLKAALKRINKSYSSIPLSAIQSKLGNLGTVNDIRYLIAKAIKDGVIKAKIDPTGTLMISTPASDIYYEKSGEAQQILHDRIQTCQQLINDTVRAMQYSSKIVNEPDQIAERLPTDMELMEEYMEAGDDFI